MSDDAYRITRIWKWGFILILGVWMKIHALRTTWTSIRTHQIVFSRKEVSRENEVALTWYKHAVLRQKRNLTLSSVCGLRHPWKHWRLYGTTCVLRNTNETSTTHLTKVLQYSAGGPQVLLRDVRSCFEHWTHQTFGSGYGHGYWQMEVI